MKRFRFFWWLIAGPLAVLLAVLALAHPYLAITHPSGGRTMVVEGWISDTAMARAAALFRSSGYTHAYTTGSVRDFTYYLDPGQSIGIAFESARHGELIVHASGVSGAGFAVIAAHDTLMKQWVSGDTKAYHLAIDRPLDSLMISAIGQRSWPAGSRILFLRSCVLAGKNIHLLQRSTVFTNADGSRSPAWPTWAHRAADQLQRDGIPAERIAAVPTYGEPDSRSWASAATFGIKAVEDGVDTFDVVTLGVHARRSRNLFQQGVAKGTVVGVIALPDPLCAAGSWWKSSTGWYRMLKEIGGSPEAYAVELTR